jgi:hypothetical protein
MSLLRKYQKGDKLTVNEKRYNELYKPLISHIEKSLPAALPLSTLYELEKVFNGGQDTDGTRNIPPLTPTLKEIQKKFLGLRPTEIKKLLETDWRNLTLPEVLAKTPKNISYREMFKYSNHIKDLRDKGYTFKKGGNLLHKYQKGDTFKQPTVYVSDKVERSYYHPVEKTMYLSPKDAKDKGVVAHEYIHYLQDISGDMHVPVNGPVKVPTIPMTDEASAYYYNRKGLEAQDRIDYIKSLGEFRFVPDDVIYDKEVDAMMYDEPSTIEGSAYKWQKNVADEHPGFQDFYNNFIKKK